MNQRSWLLLTLLVGIFALPTCSSATREPDPPAAEGWNILWISVEDMSPRLGSYGDPVTRTPRLDQLAAEGMRFTQSSTHRLN